MERVGESWREKERERERERESWRECWRERWREWWREWWNKLVMVGEKSVRLEVQNCVRGVCLNNVIGECQTGVLEESDKG